MFLCVRAMDTKGLSLSRFEAYIYILKCECVCVYFLLIISRLFSFNFKFSDFFCVGFDVNCGISCGE